MTDKELEMFMAKLRRLVYENDNDSLIGNNSLIEARKPELQLLYEELGYLIGTCFKDEDELEDSGNWKRKLIEAAHKAEDTVDMFISSAFIKNNVLRELMYKQMSDNLLDCSLKGVMDDLKSIRAKIKSNKIKSNKIKRNWQDMMMSSKIEATGTCSSENTRVNLSATEREEFIVGFEDDALLVIDRLTGDRKKLDIISIVGMGGLGKTTLATKIFRDSLVEYYFDKRGWATVSQAYSKRNLLRQLLVSIGESVPETELESKLCEKLYQSLKGRRYLIVVDDIWSCKVWEDVGICFPDDKTGSRVLLTTRLTEVAWHASQGGFTHNLGHLSKDQSWELLCKKTFRGHECPETLIETGKYIAKKCGGLPLALVVIAGVLEKGKKRKDLWEKIAECVGSYIINDPKGCLDTLALSYDHLPSHLKKCFLYVGGFPEDYKIQVQRLIRLWMAEGLIKEGGQRSLEEEGEYYIMDLIDRNLLVVADKSSNGGVKSCNLHDLLRELCLKKADEEHFFKKVGKFLPSFNCGMVKQHRLFTDYEALCKIRSFEFAKHIRSVLGFSSGRSNHYKLRPWISLFLLLRVLDLLHISIVDLSTVSILLHLRYLAVWPSRFEYSPGVQLFLPKANLRSLQTLIIKGEYHSFTYSPDNMVNLRHLRCDMINFPFGQRSLILEVPKLHVFTTLSKLQTISRLILDHMTQSLLESFPDIKKLGCSVSSESSNHGLLSFAMLTHLEALNIDTHLHFPVTLANPIIFPETLRKLTLSRLRLPWSHMSTIQQLPKLEVLKLLESSFSGHLWDIGDEQFHQLKYLKLERLSIHVWKASSINFPCLRKLAVRRCKDLNEIPLVLGNISTLEHIEIDNSNSRLLDSVNRIQKAQHETGNDDIHVKIFR